MQSNHLEYVEEKMRAGAAGDAAETGWGLICALRASRLWRWGANGGGMAD